jgi:hypothetical protein
MNRAQDAIQAHSDAVEWLRDEFSRRVARNSHYSLRAFAKQLQINSGPLSEILAKKRNLSLSMARRITDRLMFTPTERERFLSLLADPVASPGQYKTLEDDSFRVISDWTHFAILSLLETKGAHSDPRWVSGRLGITALEAQSALERLERLGMVRRNDQALVPVTGWTTTHDVPSEARQKFHRQSLQLVARALDDVPMPERDVTSVTVAVDSNLPRAKSLIKKFRRQLAALLETGEPGEVYQLNVQLIPVTRKEPNNA